MEIKVQKQKEIVTTKAPAAIGPYSQAVEIGDLVFVSGQIPFNPVSGKLEHADIKGQARQSLENVKAIVEAAGLTLANVVKVNVSLTDMGAFADVNAIYAEYFTGAIKPARAVVQVAALPKQVLIEIEAIAHR
jgi:2-iminobutanoate/2-iminopropanoate deaminase